jgi:hypothetical protein
MNAQIEPTDWVLANTSGDALPFGRVGAVIQMQSATQGFSAAHMTL